jgi:hypothetical protein
MYGHITSVSGIFILNLLYSKLPFVEKKVRLLHKLTAAMYIKPYKRHSYPMKIDVTNIHYNTI